MSGFLKSTIIQICGEYAYGTVLEIDKCGLNDERGRLKYEVKIRSKTYKRWERSISCSYVDTLLVGQRCIVKYFIFYPSINTTVGRVSEGVKIKKY